jgi:hypothetical protein
VTRTKHEYPRGLRGPGAEDALLVLAWVAFLAFVDVPPSVRALMLAAIPIVLGWGVATLHFPSSVEMSDNGIAFARYGRVHRFAWSEVKRVRVRRFLVRDRVLVRLEPSTAWRGRYWLTDAMDGFEAVVAQLEELTR